MLSSTFQELYSSIEQYYLTNVDGTDNGNSRISDLIDQKIEQLQSNKPRSELFIQWKNFVNTLEQEIELDLINCFDLQFPSISFRLEQSNIDGKYFEKKSFVFIASLLTPYFTFYKEYRLSIQSEIRGLKRLIEIGVLKSESFANYLELNLEIESDLIVEKFLELLPEFKFVSFPYLVNNMVENRIPYGSTQFGVQKRSVFEYLFGLDEERYKLV
ncbi:MAG: hypothetical protein AAGF85_02055 [Bacteroidota bacterium]